MVACLLFKCVCTNHLTRVDWVTCPTMTHLVVYYLLLPGLIVIPAEEVISHLYVSSLVIFDSFRMNFASC